MDRQQIGISSCWTRSLQRGERPTRENLRNHLLAVHREYAGFTEKCAWHCRDDAGRNSYQMLAELIDPNQHRAVLDLACGSGVLIELCRKLHGNQIGLSGLDMSLEELSIARDRIPDKGVRFHHGLAQNLSFAKGASFDVVLCHWALTLMDPIAPVLSEIKRVLAKGGVFGAIIDGDRSTVPSYAEIHDLIYNYVQTEYPNYTAYELGDPRVRSTESLRELIEGEFSAAELHVEPIILTWEATPALLARAAAGFFYASLVLSEKLHAEMLDELQLLFATQHTRKKACFSMPINRVLVRKTRDHEPRASGKASQKSCRD